jgi:carboxyl-terminal processing protease
MDLSLEGIGATLSSQDGYTVIEQLIRGGAAEASKQLEIKDKIMAVGQAKGEMVPVYDMSLRDVVKLIRGPAGTKVKLKILRKGKEGTKRFEVTLVRRKINLEEEAAKIYYVDHKVGKKNYKVGIINLPSFYSASKKGGRSAAGDVKKILKEAKKKKVDSLVLDFSTNGGGSLDDAVKIAGLFFKQGNVVETNRSKLADLDPAVDYSGPLVVLTSRLSASASEIVAGALQDYKRAVIVGGDHTFGKGSVQSVIPLGQFLGAIKVTVGMFYIPGGHSTQHRGVEADIVLPGAFSTDEVGEKTLDYSLPPSKITPFLSKAAYVKSGDEAWTPVTKAMIQKLRKNSQARVAKNEEFQKIIKEAKEEKNKKKVIKIAEILDDTKKEELEEAKKKRNLSPKEKEKDYLERADIQEAVNVAAELAVIHVPGQVIGAHSKKPSSKKN